MSKKANPTVIGAFIIGAIAIMTILILLLSGNILFKKDIKAIMFFEGSVTGLNVGAPVKFRGVKIGTVTDIKIILDETTQTVTVPVLAEIDQESYLVKLKDKIVKASEVDLKSDKYKSSGLFAQLKLNSLLTGQLYIELEFDPEGKHKFYGDGSIREIPTRATTMQEITKTLEKYPITEVLNNIASTMDSLNKIFSDPVILETVHSVNHAAKEYEVLAKQLRTDSTNLTSNLNKTLEQADKTFIQIDQSLASARKTLKTTDGLLREDSQLMYSLQDALNEVANAARSVRALADTLEQQPEAILRGKSAGGN